MISATRNRILRSASSLLLIVIASTTVAGQGLFRLTEEQEIELGRAAAVEIEKHQPILTDRQVERYVDNLGQLLVRHSGRSNIRYTFKVVDSADVNAFALPGGFIYVNRGLIQAAGNEAELAGVMGHEIGHVVGRHSVEQIRRMQLTGLGLGLLDLLLGRGRTGTIANLGARMVATGAFLKYSRDAEREADRLGAKNLHDADYDPMAMVTFFEKLAEMRQREPSRVEQFLSTHPIPTERAESIRNLIATFPPKRNLRTDSAQFRSIQQRIERLPPPRAQSERS